MVEKALFVMILRLKEFTLIMSRFLMLIGRCRKSCLVRIEEEER
jgi:hypothetical protein